MNIEIKKSKNPIKYKDAVDFMEKHQLNLSQSKTTDLIWILEHEEVYTGGKNYKENEILDKSINVVK